MNVTESILTERTPSNIAQKIRSLSHAPDDETLTGGAALLDVLLLHEDLATSMRARAVIKRLRSALNIKVNMVVNPWRLEALDNPLLNEMALNDARRAGIVFVSLHGEREISPLLRNWLDTWMRARESAPAALVVSLDAETEGTAAAEAILRYVRQLITGSNVEVFPHFDAVPSPADEWMFENSKRAPAAPLSAALYPPEPQPALGAVE